MDRNSPPAGVDENMTDDQPGEVRHPSLVTIGIPTYNRSASLRRAVSSALAQDYGPLEVVISDNGSSDDTESYCRELERTDRRVRYVRQPENRGALANFLAVLDAAAGRYFMWLADDDVLDPDYVSECVAVLDVEPGTVLVAGRGFLRFPDGSTQADVTITVDAERPDRRVLGYYRTVGRNSVFYGVGRTSALRQAGPIRGVIGGDWLFVAALAFEGPVRTVGTTAIRRSAAGASDDLRVLARSSGLGPLARTLPRLSLVTNIARDLAGSPTYRSLPFGPRLALAGASAASAGWRVGIRFHLVRAVLALRRRWSDHSSGGHARSRSDMVSGPTSGQAMPMSGSSNRTP